MGLEGADLNLQSELSARIVYRLFGDVYAAHVPVPSRKLQKEAMRAPGLEQFAASAVLPQSVEALTKVALHARLVSYVVGIGGVSFEELS